MIVLAVWILVFWFVLRPCLGALLELRSRRRWQRLGARDRAYKLITGKTEAEERAANWRGCCDDGLSEQEYVDLQQALIDDPDAGDVVAGSGGVGQIRKEIEDA